MKDGQLKQLVSLAVANHSPEELALGWLRYETVRTMSPRLFAKIVHRNLGGEWFDDIVTETIPAPFIRPVDAGRTFSA